MTKFKQILTEKEDEIDLKKADVLEKKASLTADTYNNNLQTDIIDRESRLSGLERRFVKGESALYKDIIQTIHDIEILRAEFKNSEKYKAGLFADVK